MPCLSLQVREAKELLEGDPISPGSATGPVHEASESMGEKGNNGSVRKMKGSSASGGCKNAVSSRSSSSLPASGAQHQGDTDPGAAAAARAEANMAAASASAAAAESQQLCEEASELARSLGEKYANDTAAAAEAVSVAAAADRKDAVEAISPVLARRRSAVSGSGTANEPQSRFVGVVWARARKQWRTVVVISGVPSTLGHFDSEDEAALVYDMEASAHGDLLANSVLPTSLTHPLL